MTPDLSEVLTALDAVDGQFYDLRTLTAKASPQVKRRVLLCHAALMRAKADVLMASASDESEVDG